MNMLIRVACPSNRELIEEALGKLDLDLYFVKDDAQMLSALHLSSIDAVIIDATGELHLALSTLDKLRSFTEEIDLPVLLCCENEELASVLANTIEYEKKDANTTLVVLSEPDAAQFTIKVAKLFSQPVALT